MRSPFPLSATLLVIAACASTPPPQTAQAVAQQPQPEPAATRPMRPGAVLIPSRGLSCRSAIAIEATNEHDGIAKENAWIAENYPGAKKVLQALTSCNDKPADRIDIETANGQKVSVYFDISQWFPNRD